MYVINKKGTACAYAYLTNFVLGVMAKSYERGVHGCKLHDANQITHMTHTESQHITQTNICA